MIRRILSVLGIALLVTGCVSSQPKLALLSAQTDYFDGCPVDQIAISNRVQGFDTQTYHAVGCGKHAMCTTDDMGRGPARCWPLERTAQ
jgi:hypothetical protein